MPEKIFRCSHGCYLQIDILEKHCKTCARKGKDDVRSESVLYTIDDRYRSASNHELPPARYSNVKAPAIEGNPQEVRSVQAFPVSREVSQLYKAEREPSTHYLSSQAPSSHLLPEKESPDIVTYAKSNTDVEPEKRRANLQFSGVPETTTPGRPRTAKSTQTLPRDPETGQFREIPGPSTSTHGYDDQETGGGDSSSDEDDFYTTTYDTEKFQNRRSTITIKSEKKKKSKKGLSSGQPNDSEEDPNKIYSKTSFPTRDGGISSDYPSDTQEDPNKYYSKSSFPTRDGGVSSDYPNDTQGDPNKFHTESSFPTRDGGVSSDYPTDTQDDPNKSYSKSFPTRPSTNYPIDAQDDPNKSYTKSSLYTRPSGISRHYPTDAEDDPDKSYTKPSLHTRPSGVSRHYPTDAEDDPDKSYTKPSLHTRPSGVSRHYPTDADDDPDKSYTKPSLHTRPSGVSRHYPTDAHGDPDKSYTKPSLHTRPSGVSRHYPTDAQEDPNKYYSKSTRESRVSPDDYEGSYVTAQALDRDDDGDRYDARSSAFQPTSRQSEQYRRSNAPTTAVYSSLGQQQSAGLSSRCGTRGGGASRSATRQLAPSYGFDCNCSIPARTDSQVPPQADDYVYASADGQQQQQQTVYQVQEDPDFETGCSCQGTDPVDCTDYRCENCVCPRYLDQFAMNRGQQSYVYVSTTSPEDFTSDACDVCISCDAVCAQKEKEESIPLEESTPKREPKRGFFSKLCSCGSKKQTVSGQSSTADTAPTKRSTIDSQMPLERPSSIPTYTSLTEPPERVSTMPVPPERTSTISSYRGSASPKPEMSDSCNQCYTCEGACDGVCSDETKDEEPLVVEEKREQPKRGFFSKLCGSKRQPVSADASQTLEPTKDTPVWNKGSASSPRGSASSPRGTVTTPRCSRDAGRVSQRPTVTTSAASGPLYLQEVFVPGYSEHLYRITEVPQPVFTVYVNDDAEAEPEPDAEPDAEQEQVVQYLSQTCPRCGRSLCDL